MNKLHTQHIIFRLIFPIIFGIVAYLIVLMVFDSIASIIDNFFSQEVAFFILLSFTLFESLAVTYRFIKQKITLEQKRLLKIALYVLASIIVSITIVSVYVYLYFTLIEKSSIFQTELIIFNFIMVFASILYLLVYYSITLINQHTQKALEIKTLEIKNLQKQLKLLKHNIQPEILFKSFENLILIIYEDKKAADDFIEKLSNYYRNIINEQNKELISLHDELQMTQQLIYLLNYKLDKHVYFDDIKDENLKYLILPGILRQVVFFAIQNNIISEFIPLKVLFNFSDNYLIIKFKQHNKFNNNKNNAFDIFTEKYKYYSDKKIFIENNNDFYQISVPVLLPI